MITKNLEEFVTKHKIMYAVVIDLINYVQYSLGNKNDLTYEGLYNSLFYNTQSIITLNESLKGQIMPQSWKQGDLKCLVVKPNETILVGLFYIDVPNTVDSYKLAKQINNELVELFVERHINIG